MGEVVKFPLKKSIVVVMGQRYFKLWNKNTSAAKTFLLSLPETIRKSVRDYAEFLWQQKRNN